MRESRKIVAVLRQDRKVKTECVAKLLDIFGARTFAEHLLHGITGNNVAGSVKRSR